MRIPKSEFTDADLKLCRAHGDAVFGHYPMPSFTAAESARFKAATAYRAACNDFERVTLDQAQSDAYWQWQHEVHSRVSIGVDLAQPCSDTTAVTLAPAKPAGQEPGQSQAAPLVPGDRIIITCGNDHYFCTGDTGTVVAVDKDGDLEVQFDIHSRARKGCTWFVNPTWADRHLGCFATAEEEHLS